MKVAFANAVLLATSGCAIWFGPADGRLYVVGSTPRAIPCELSLGPVGASSGPFARTVSGEFREKFVVHPSRKGHRAQLVCEGAVVSSRAFKYGRDVGFGGDLPVARVVP